jgi:hypothetical protein
MKAIVTVPPYAPFVGEVARHQAVSGVRLNTVMPIKGELEDTLKALQDKAGDKDFWIDLKCRQLRVQGYFVPPYTEVRLSHRIRVDTPATAYFGSGTESATVVAVDGDRLITLDGPRRVVGPGESVNIIHPSLSIEGYLTDRDKSYVEAANKVGLKKYMLSYVERNEDLAGFDGMDIVAKIESRKGLDYVRHDWVGATRLMAARGDLHVELEKPHNMIDALELIISKDREAIVASRIFPSLSTSLEPSCEDIGDADNLMRMGYRTFMFGDEICMRRDSIMSGLNLFYAMGERYV